MSIAADLFGSKPEVPKIPKISLADMQQEAANANLAVTPQAGKLGTFTEDQVLSMMRRVIPNFDEITGAANANIASEVKGEIPKDVQEAIQNNAAARSLGSGTAGSGMGRDLVARDLGLNSLQLTERGLSSAESWIAEADRINSPAIAATQGMWITPMQQYSTTNEQNMQQFQQRWMQNQIDAMPDPQVTGAIRMAMSTIGAVAGGVAGGPMGAGMGAQMGGGMADSMLGKQGDRRMPTWDYHPSNNYYSGGGGGGGGGGMDTGFTDAYGTSFDPGWMEQGGAAEGAVIAG